MAKTALVVGNRGQDGRLLSTFLCGRGYRVVGIDAHTTEGLPEPIDICSSDSVLQAIQLAEPDEIYHLAAIHESSDEPASMSPSLIKSMWEVNYLSLVYLLDAVVRHRPVARLFFAASSHVFGSSPPANQDECSPFAPTSIYAMTKADGIHTCRIYRRDFGLFASCGIMYTHESAFRQEKFLAKRVVSSIGRILAGENLTVGIGDLSARVDWGYAPEYVDAMWRVLQSSRGDDYVIATGQPIAVGDFVQAAFELAGLDWREHVIEEPGRLGRIMPNLVGNPQKIEREIGWRAQAGAKSLAALLLRDAGVSIVGDCH